MNAHYCSEILLSLAQVFLQAAILVLLVLLLQWLFHRQFFPRWKCAIWLLVVIPFFLPVSLQGAENIFNSQTKTNDIPAPSSETPIGAFRLYRINIDTLTSALESKLGKGVKSQPLDQTLGQYFTPEGASTKSSFLAWYNRRSQLLFWRAPIAVLDRFEQEFKGTFTSICKPPLVRASSDLASESGQTNLYNMIFKIDLDAFIRGMETFYLRESPPSFSRRFTAPKFSKGELRKYIEAGDFLINSNLIDPPLPSISSESISPGMMPDSGTGFRELTHSTEMLTLEDVMRPYLSLTTGLNFGGFALPPLETRSAIFSESTPVRALFLNDRSGILFVRATMAELQTLETVLRFLIAPLPPPVKKERNQSAEVLKWNQIRR